MNCKKSRNLLFLTILSFSAPTSTTTTQASSEEVATDKILGVGGLGGLYPALHKYAKCHYNGSVYDNGDIVSTFSITLS